MKTIFLLVLIFIMSCGIAHYDRRSIFEEQGRESTSIGVEGDQQEQEDSKVSSQKSSSPDIASNSSSGSLSTSSQENTFSEETSEHISPEPEFLFDRVMITELVTDPQQDHGESSGGNGILFDAIPGTGTVGTTDEYIEVYNGTETALNVSFWTLNMLDGTDESQVLADEAWDVFFSDEGSVENFSPGEFLILGNPQGAMNNTVTLELIDENGGIVDQVFVDDANAEGFSDEAHFLDETGTWIQGVASPAGF